jgi:hypothetical protein
MANEHLEERDKFKRLLLIRLISVKWALTSLVRIRYPDIQEASFNGIGNGARQS